MNLLRRKSTFIYIDQILYDKWNNMYEHNLNDSYLLKIHWRIEAVSPLTEFFYEKKNETNFKLPLVCTKIDHRRRRIC